MSRYHREHHERSYRPAQLQAWIERAGGRVIAIRFAGFVPTFPPDWIAKLMTRIEPAVEGAPLINRVACAVYVTVAVRSPIQK